MVPTIRGCCAAVRRSWLMILQSFTVASLLLLLGLVALNEVIVVGIITVFLLLATPALALVLCSRRMFSTAFLIGACVLLIAAANAQKRALLDGHLHLFDLFLLWTYYSALIRSYWELVLYASLCVASVAALFIVLRRVENKGFRSSRYWSGSAWALPILGGAACINAVMFFNGNYFSATSDLFVSGRLYRTPTTVSYLLSSVTDYMRVTRALRGVKSSAPTLDEPVLCVDCPDVIAIHVESVFDPKLLKAYSDEPPIGDQIGDALQSASGALRAHVIGGWSVVSEFSFNCGMDHRLFGQAGLVPTEFVAPFVRRCVPGYLRDHGYSTTLISSVPRQWNGRAYEAYGIQVIYPPGTLGIPTHWPEMRDGRFVDAAIELLSKPRTSPRLIMLLTNFNHGPHGRTPTHYPGPYDLSSASSKELKDYIDRLE